MNAKPERMTGAGNPPTPSEPGSGSRAEGSVLNLDRLSLSFGGLQALSDLDLQARDREIVSVIRPNGAGKTTLFHVITGVYQPRSGDLRCAGQSIARRPPPSIAPPGLGRPY